MHGPINVKSPNNTSKWQMGFNSAFKGLTAVGSKPDLSVENPVNNGLNSSTSLEAKVKAINTTYDTKQVTTRLLLTSP